MASDAYRHNVIGQAVSCSLQSQAAVGKHADVLQAKCAADKRVIVSSMTSLSAALPEMQQAWRG